ncbi:hypothetical protein B6S12_06910 [Helicobacter valdiviensis]|uniref:Zinc/iron-chelating domain-containing protein n=1 Tax=Helicobacter valdiviensis TaxID=1458358 RepID=A0A2W6PMI2_9HELI|nr:YkgJ family cysteine cluster protein [Helicobacter valdiviensis]PZT47883.1 hypothetical protein B6S12_06910 [Helicobacter valdiviensis]
MKNEIFPCTSCGACCKNIGKVDELKEFNNNGVCINLQNDNTCKIYHMRPLVCRVDELYEKYFSKQMSRIDFYNENIKICNSLQEKFNIEKKYRINFLNKEN